MTDPRTDRRALATEPHHDGSEYYLSVPERTLGATATARIRVPRESCADRVRLRTLVDAEPAIVEATIERADAHATWWTVQFPLAAPVTTYRFLLTGGEIDHAWLDQAGISRLDVNDTHDFRILVDRPPPQWLGATVGYQIFIDRFATSIDVSDDRPAGRDVPKWVIRSRWDADLIADGVNGMKQWYGGDFAGIEQRLDHLQRLGVNLVYVTPFFPAGSTHRYDARRFDEVDPLLGGDAALSSFVDAAHDRGIRVIGDITLNHTGQHHSWFERARADPDSVERDFYTFDDDTEHGYVAWHDVASLPKLDHRSKELATRLYSGSDSVIAHFLQPPFNLDGWRVDCANTTARQGAIDSNHSVAAQTLATVNDHTPEGWLVAEHCYDASTDLGVNSWHGVMAYQWISRPLAAWLHDGGEYSLLSQFTLAKLDAGETVESIRRLGATISWAARAASMTMLDSHDSPRFRSIVGGSAQRHLVANAALLTLQGVPTLFAGSEVGVVGESMDSARLPFPWNESDWDLEFFEATSRLVELRTRRPALQHGALRWVGADASSMTFVREHADEALLVHLQCEPGEPVEVELSDLDVPVSSPFPMVTVFGDTAERVGDRLRLSGAVGAVIVVLRNEVQTVAELN